MEEEIKVGKIEMQLLRAYLNQIDFWAKFRSCVFCCTACVWVIVQSVTKVRPRMVFAAVLSPSQRLVLAGQDDRVRRCRRSSSLPAEMLSDSPHHVPTRG